MKDESVLTVLTVPSLTKIIIANIGIVYVLFTGNWNQKTSAKCIKIKRNDKYKWSRNVLIQMKNK